MSATAEKKTKVCLLTGASGTIGFAIAKALKASDVDWHILVIGRRPGLDYCDKFLKVDSFSDEDAVHGPEDEMLTLAQGLFNDPTAACEDDNFEDTVETISNPGKFGVKGSSVFVPLDVWDPERLLVFILRKQSLDLLHSRGRIQCA